MVESKLFNPNFAAHSKRNCQRSNRLQDFFVDQKESLQSQDDDANDLDFEATPKKARVPLKPKRKEKIVNKEILPTASSQNLEKRKIPKNVSVFDLIMPWKTEVKSSSEAKSS